MKQLLETIYKENIDIFRAEYAEKGWVNDWWESVHEWCTMYLVYDYYRLLHYWWWYLKQRMKQNIMKLTVVIVWKNVIIIVLNGILIWRCCSVWFIIYYLHEFLNDVMGILQGMKRNLKKMSFKLEVEFIFNGEHDR